MQRAGIILVIAFYVLNSYLAMLETLGTSTSTKLHRDEILRAFGAQSEESDVAYIRHCNLSMVDPDAFSVFRECLFQKLDSKGTNISQKAASLRVNESDIKDEVALQGLELFSRAAGACNFSEYQPTVPQTALMLSGNPASSISVLQDPPEDMARIVFCISAFSDFPQLEQLVGAILLPHHLIIIHLERRTPPDFVAHVEQLSKIHKNIIVLQFGSVIYPTDSISHIFLQIMQWVTKDLGLGYDYLMTLGSSTYPLFNAPDMARFLKKDGRRVRLGRMIYGNGKGLCLRHAVSFSIVFSRGMGKKEKILDDNMNIFLANIQMPNGTLLPPATAFLPRSIARCTKKVNSGNTAAYDRDTVLDLLESGDAKDILSRFKQAGGCCNEESSWGGALASIGRGPDVDKVGMMWQAWPCQSAMHNIQLTGKIGCIHIFDSAAGWVRGGRKISGLEEIEQELKNAKDRGHLFARKFSSSDLHWINWIKQHLHNGTTNML